jgi:hypothetical protein
VIRAAALMLGLALVSAPAFAQSQTVPVNTAPQQTVPVQTAAAQPDAARRALAERLVATVNTDELIAEGRRAVGAQAPDPALSQEAKDWVRRTAPDAAEQTSREALPLLQARFLEAYTGAFTAEELEKLVGIQTFLNEPRIVEAQRVAMLAPTQEGRVQAIRAGLSPEDFTKYVEAARSPLLPKFSQATTGVLTAFRPVFDASFDAAMRQRCAGAPAGPRWCSAG